MIIYVSHALTLSLSSLCLISVPLFSSLFQYASYGSELTPSCFCLRYSTHIVEMNTATLDPSTLNSNDPTPVDRIHITNDVSTEESSAGIHPPTSSSTPARSRVLELQHMNVYFKRHALDSSEHNRARFTEYTKSHGGTDPPPEYFSSAPSASVDNAGNGVPPSHATAEGAIAPTAGTAPSSVPSGGVGPSSTSSSSSVVRITSVEDVFRLFGQCYSWAAPQLQVQQRSLDVMGYADLLSKPKLPPMSVLQQNLMHDGTQPNTQTHMRTIQPGQQSSSRPATQQQYQQQQLQSRSGSNSQLPTQGGYRPPPLQTNQQQLHSAENYKRKMEDQQQQQQSVGSKVRKESYETDAAQQRTRVALEMNARMHGAPIQPHLQQSFVNGQIKGNIAGSPMHRAAPGPPGSTTQHQQPPVRNAMTDIVLPGIPPAVLNSLTQRIQNRLRISAPSAYADGSPSSANVVGRCHLDVSRLVEKVGAVISSVSDGRLSLSNTEQQAATLELLTRATEQFLREIISVARSQSKRRQDQCRGYLPTEISSDPRAQLNELQKSAEERRARLTKHREIKKLADKKAAERAQAKVPTEGKAVETYAEAKAREEAEAQAALLAKHEAAVELALKQARSAAESDLAADGVKKPLPHSSSSPPSIPSVIGGAGSAAAAAAASAEDEYVMSLFGGGGLNLPGATQAPTVNPTLPATSTAPTSVPTAAATVPSGLPPSTLPPSTFTSILPPSSFSAGLPPSRITGTTALSGSSSSNITINFLDILSSMESFPHLRRSSRLYASYLLLAKKATATLTNTQSSPPAPAPHATVQPTAIPSPSEAVAAPVNTVTQSMQL
jgi:hypothetical protein